MGSTCNVDELLDGATIASTGAGVSCSWKDDSVVLVIFGQGESFQTVSQWRRGHSVPEELILRGNRHALWHPVQRGGLVVAHKLRMPQ